MGLPCVRAVYYDVLHISPSQIRICLQNESQHACGYGAIYVGKSVSKKESTQQKHIYYLAAEVPPKSNAHASLPARPWLLLVVDVVILRPAPLPGATAMRGPPDSLYHDTSPLDAF